MTSFIAKEKSTDSLIREVWITFLPLTTHKPQWSVNSGLWLTKIMWFKRH